MTTRRSSRGSGPRSGPRWSAGVTCAVALTSVGHGRQRRRLPGAGSARDQGQTVRAQREVADDVRQAELRMRIGAGSTWRRTAPGRPRKRKALTRNRSPGSARPRSRRRTPPGTGRRAAPASSPAAGRSGCRCRGPACPSLLQRRRRPDARAARPHGGAGRTPRSRQAPEATVRSPAARVPPSSRSPGPPGGVPASQGIGSRRPALTAVGCPKVPRAAVSNAVPIPGSSAGGGLPMPGEKVCHAAKPHDRFRRNCGTKHSSASTSDTPAVRAVGISAGSTPTITAVGAAPVAPGRGERGRGARLG